MKRLKTESGAAVVPRVAGVVVGPGSSPKTEEREGSTKKTEGLGGYLGDCFRRNKADPGNF